MAYLLARRDNSLKERMEDPDCDRRMLFNTYRQFQTINKMLSGWRGLYARHIRPLLQKNTACSLLDIGFGGGDLPLALHRWSKKEGYRLNITAIETDRRALEFVENEYSDLPSHMDFQLTNIEKLISENRQFDIVISNHLLHHLSPDELHSLAAQAETLSRHIVIFNDLERRDAAYLLFSTFIAPFFRRSFAAQDGRRSIRRSYTRTELHSILPDSWSVRRQFPFRLIATYRHDV